jgi:hypothetical protein
MGAQHELHDEEAGDEGRQGASLVQRPISLGPAGGAALALVVDSQVDLTVGGLMIETLLQPADCLFLFVDYQAGLAFGVESIARQTILKTPFLWLAPPWCGVLRRMEAAGAKMTLLDPSAAGVSTRLDQA